MTTGGASSLTTWRSEVGHAVLVVMLLVIVVPVGLALVLFQVASAQESLLFVLVPSVAIGSAVLGLVVSVACLVGRRAGRRQRVPDVAVPQRADD